MEKWLSFVPSSISQVVFRFSCCLSFMWNPFSHLLDLFHGFQTYGDGFSYHIQLIRELLSLSVILIQQFAVFKLFQWFSMFFVSHVKIATFEFFKSLKALWFTKSMLTVSFDKHSIAILQQFSSNGNRKSMLSANRSFHKIRHVQRCYKLYCCMKLVLLWVENLCQMSEQGNGATTLTATKLTAIYW